MRQWTKERYPKDWRKFSNIYCEKIGHCELCGKRKDQVHHLTIHHQDGDPSNNNGCNLIVCCPKCHFAIQNAGYISKERYKKNKRLQINLFERR